MNRRTLLAGIGMLAAGSGATTMSAALANEVRSTADFRVITAGKVSVRAGPAFDDDGSVGDGTFEDTDGETIAYEERYVAYADTEDSMFFEPGDGLNDIEVDDIPVATVNAREDNVNEDLEMETAISVSQEKEQMVFGDMLGIENTTGDTVEIGIGYDRDADQYGDDVDEDGDLEEDVTPNLVQHIYQFRAGGDNRISPDPGDGDDFPDENEAGDWEAIDPGETVSIDLQIDLTDWEFLLGAANTKEILRDEADEDPFETTVNTVDLLDEITVGTRDN